MTAKQGMLRIPKRKYGAYLYDCDGTIADSMPLHFAAWTAALKPWNCAFPEKLFYAWGGIPPLTIIEGLNQAQGLKMIPEVVNRKREEHYILMLPTVKAVPEVVDHIEKYSGRVPMAVVSGSSRISVETTLKSLGLLERFDTLVTAEDYRKGKPHPEAFLTAAQRLKIEPRDCLVFEDAEMGLKAAEAAGMDAVKIPSRFALG